MIVVAKQRRPRQPAHHIVASCRDTDLYRRVTTRLVCKCGWSVRGTVTDAARAMAAHRVEGAGVVLFRRV